jgi:stage II sporulation protein D
MPGRSIPLALVAVGALGAFLPPASPRAATAHTTQLLRAPLRSAQSTPLPTVRFTAPPGGSILVHGTYPQSTFSACVDPVQPVLHTRHAGTIEVGKARDGSLFVIGELPFEEYVAGIAEMPRTWPLEALKAQVVAARTYALARMDDPDRIGESLGYQICATTSCQVYRGLGVAEGPYGERWRAAVGQTAGQVLLHQGRPADTLYFSTSNGRTYGNDEIFGSSPVPYLRPVTETDDGASPLSEWRVSLPLSDVARFLRAAGRWNPKPVANVRRDGPEIVVASGEGTVERIDVQDFRESMNDWAPCLAPSRYPPLDSDGAALPQTIPSRWFSTSVQGGSVVFEGAGWGHGVGMVQWGAYGKATRGLSYGDILASYYGGLRPVPHSVPTTIRVGIATGLTSVRLSAIGDVAIEGRIPVPGPWLVTGGSKLQLRHADPPPSYLSPGVIAGAPKQVRAGRSMRVTVDLQEVSVVRLVLAANGAEFPLSLPVTREAGTSSLEASTRGVPGGLYEIRAVVSDGIDIVRTPPRQVRVIGPSPGVSPTPSPEPTPRTSPSLPAAAPSPTLAAQPPNDPGQSEWVLPLAIATGAIVVGSMVALAIRRQRTRPPATPPAP